MIFARYVSLLCVVLHLATMGRAATANGEPAWEEFPNVRYLPDWRYSGDPGPKRDGEMLMDVYVPRDGKAQHPVLFVVHGGGWSAGDKRERVYREIIEYFTTRGFVCVGFNYILRPRGVFPQVFWDYHDAARFLRANAETYRIDPARFGAIGLSAGGWLISSAGHGSGDLYLINHEHSHPITKVADRNWALPASKLEENWLRIQENPAPAYPGVYGRFQAISMDFHFRMIHASGNTPSFSNWVGKGYRGKPNEIAVLEQKQFDEVPVVFEHLRGKLHVPPLFSSVDPKTGADRALACLNGQGELRPAIEAVYAFFDEQLRRNPRAPVPEIWPAWRTFASSNTVSFVMPPGSYTVRYRVEPYRKSEPRPDTSDWRTWDVYTGPFTVTDDCVVHAVAEGDGAARPSTFAEAHYFKGPLPLRVLAPDSDVLPPARTGEAYRIEFKADRPNARWWMAGDLVPRMDRDAITMIYPNRMMLHPGTGVWSGTPVRPGRYWIQVWVNGGNGQIAGYRNYTWTVEGEDLSDGVQETAVLYDDNVELAYVSAVGKGDASLLASAFRAAGVRYILEDDGNGILVLVRDQDKQAGKAALLKHREQFRKLEVEWR